MFILHTIGQGIFNHIPFLVISLWTCTYSIYFSMTIYIYVCIYIYIHICTYSIHTRSYKYNHTKLYRYLLNIVRFIISLWHVSVYIYIGILSCINPNIHVCICWGRCQHVCTQQIIVELVVFVGELLLCNVHVIIIFSIYAQTPSCSKSQKTWVLRLILSSMQIFLLSSCQIYIKGFHMYNRPEQLIFSSGSPLKKPAIERSSIPLMWANQKARVEPFKTNNQKITLQTWRWFEGFVPFWYISMDVAAGCFRCFFEARLWQRHSRGCQTSPQPCSPGELIWRIPNYVPAMSRQIPAMCREIYDIFVPSPYKSI